MRELRLHLAGATSAGRRAHQEDAHCFFTVPGGALLAVADGMGGHAAGEVASRIAIEALRRRAKGPGAIGDPGGLLCAAADEANRSVLEYAKQHPEREGLGTTLVAAVVREDGIVVGHAGDSRAWLVTPEEVLQLTRDHSAVQDAIDRGTLDAADAARSPYRHAILRNVGDDAFPGLEITPAAGAIEIQDGSILLLTSDGAHGALTDADLLEHFAGTPSLDKAVDNLVRLAYHRGSDDNITLVACEVGSFPRSKARAQTPPPIAARQRGRRQRSPALPLALAGVLLVLTIGLVAALVRALRPLPPAPVELRAPSAGETPGPAPTPAVAQGVTLYATPFPTPVRTSAPPARVSPRGGQEPPAASAPPLVPPVATAAPTALAPLPEAQGEAGVAPVLLQPAQSLAPVAVPHQQTTAAPAAVPASATPLRGEPVESPHPVRSETTPKACGSPAPTPSPQGGPL